MRGDTVTCHWALVRSRATRWYHLARVVEDNGAYFEMYWHPDLHTRGPSKAVIRAHAQDLGIEPLDDVLCSPSGSTVMNKLEVM